MTDRDDQDQRVAAGMPHRRLFLLGLAASAATLASPFSMTPARAESDNPASDPKLRFIKLPVVMLPRRDPFGYVRLQMDLVIRVTPQIAVESQTVKAYQPRITGLMTELLPQDNLVGFNASPAQVEGLKRRVVQIANGAVGQPFVEEALIVGLLVG